MQGNVVNLLDRPDLAYQGSTLIDNPTRWSDSAPMPLATLFLGDIGESVVTSCFIPIQLVSMDLYIDQTYDNVFDFHAIRPEIDRQSRTYRIGQVDSVSYSGTCVLIGGSPENNWYHWILNWLPRLALTAEIAPDLIADPSVRFVLHKNVEREPFRSLVNRFNISPDRLIFTDLSNDIRFERLIVPTFCHQNYYYRKVLDLVRNKLVEQNNSNNTKNNRVYISRENIDVPKRRVANKNELFSALNSRGVVPVVLDGLEGTRQIDLFASSKLVIGVHGAGLASLIFCPPDTKVIILDNDRNIAVGMSGMFSGLCDLRGINYKLLRVDEVDVDGTDYSNFYHLHNRDVTVECSSLTTGIDELAPYRHYPIHDREDFKLDDYIRETDSLLARIQPYEGIVPSGFEVDYLGIQVGLHLIQHWYPAEMMADARVNARHRATSLPTPRAGEPYFESGSMLRAIDEGGDTIRLIELGGGYGARASELALHCRRLGKSAKSIIVEPVKQYVEWGQAHFKHNGISLDDNTFLPCAVTKDCSPVPMYTEYQGFGNEVLRGDNVVDQSQEIGIAELVSGKKIKLKDGRSIELVSGLSLEAIIGNSDVIDLIDVDVQHLEYDILMPAMDILCRRVRRIHVGTHSHSLHENIRTELALQGWAVEVDLLPFSETACLNGPTKINDGILAAYNPRFR